MGTVQSRRVPNVAQSSTWYRTLCTPTPTIKVCGYITGGLSDQVRFYVHWQMAVGELKAGDDRNILEREIASIQELLDEQPDSKCKCSARSQYRYSSSQPTNTHCRVHGIARLLQETSSEEIRRCDDQRWEARPGKRVPGPPEQAPGHRP